MAKIAVFDSGWGGDICAEYLSSELGIFQVDRIIDWKNFPYAYRTTGQVKNMVKSALKKYVGRYELIVVGNNIAALHGMKSLQKRFPRQKFVGMPFLIESVKTTPGQKVMILSTSSILFSKNYRDILEKRAGITEYTLVTCDGWIEKIDDETFSKEDVELKMKEFDMPDIVLLECTHFFAVKKQIEDYFDWKAQVVDPQLLLLRDVCKALKISTSTGKKLPSIFRKVNGKR